MYNFDNFNKDDSHAVANATKTLILTKMRGALFQTIVQKQGKDVLVNARN